MLFYFISFYFILLLVLQIETFYSFFFSLFHSKLIGNEDVHIAFDLGLKCAFKMTTCCACAALKNSPAVHGQVSLHRKLKPPVLTLRQGLSTKILAPSSCSHCTVYIADVDMAKDNYKRC